MLILTLRSTNEENALLMCANCGETLMEEYTQRGKVNLFNVYQLSMVMHHHVLTCTGPRPSKR